MQERIQKKLGLEVLAAILVVVIFVVDTRIPLGFSAWVLYGIPVILCFQSSRPRLPLTLGLVSSFLIAAGYFIASPIEEEIETISRVNRTLMILTLLSLGVYGRRFVLNRLRLLQDDWIKAGLNELNIRMRGEQSVEALGRSILTILANYLGAQVGAVWSSDESGALVQGASYAGAAKRPAQPQIIEPGQTLVGEVAASASILVVEDVPDGYLEIRSGVGAAQPRALVIVPAMADERVAGVVELGFFRPPSPAAIGLLQEAMEPMGSAFRSAKFRRRQAILLEETRRQAEELSFQQQELQTTNEELEQQSEALRKSQEFLKEQQAELEESNASLEEQTHALEHQREQLLETQQILRKNAEELTKTSQYKSEFLANMSHELRTPLNSALILAKLLADNRTGNLSPEQIQYASNIYEAGNDLLNLINDILDLAKIESGTTELSIEELSVQTLANTLRKRFEPLAAQRGLELSVTVDAGCPDRIETDPLRLQQILTNLLSNAVKFTEEGSIQVLVEAARRGELSFTVEDTGVGIPHDRQAMVFEAFRQADGTTNRRFGGTGLGLSISKELATLLGGQIELESYPDKGSRFTLRIPTRAAAAVAGEDERAAKPEPPRQDSGAPPAMVDKAAQAPAPLIEDDRATLTPGARAVLAIEDDPRFATILRGLAHEMNFRFLSAGSADEGLQLARAFDPVAIILDLNLPDHSGLTVLDLLKHSPQTRHIPVHIVSAHDYEQVAREMGVVGYALKPVKREELEEAFQSLEAHLSRKVRNILVVEDDEIQREAIHDLLAGGGVEITSTSTAEEALTLLRSRTFDCVVLDLMLPETSGFELLSRMGEEGSSHPPVIVYTARALTTDEEQLLRQHAKSIIVKGARSPERLLEEVTLFLHQVEAELPPEKRRMLQEVRNREKIFEGRRILLVEDDIRNVFALTSTLEPKGAVIEIARNGLEAIARLQEDPPIDLVLMDVMMPEMDGLSATKEIRRSPRWKRLPIIALTAKAMPDDRQECLDAGASDYIAKPIDVEKLISMIRVWMPR